jgi:hypothetical protein
VAADQNLTEQTTVTDDRALPPPPPPRSGCLTVFLIATGLVLLLPGICALGFASTDRSMLTDPTGLLIVFVCLAIAAGGIALIWAAVRRAVR